MNPIKFVGALIVGLFLVFVIRILLLVTPIAVRIEASPWWVYFVLAGIVLSGYLSFKYSKEDKDAEQRWIEQEGELFMDPIRKRRQEKMR